MRSLLLKVIALLAIAHVVPGFHVAGVFTALGIAVVYGLASFLVCLVLGAAMIAFCAGLAAAFPALGFLALLTIPLAFFLLDFLVCLGGLVVTSHVVPGFSMDGFGTAVTASILLGIVSALTSPKPSRVATES